MEINLRFTARKPLVTSRILFPVQIQIRSLRILIPIRREREDAPAVLAALSPRYKLCVATNGLSSMQAGRLAPLSPFLCRTFISEEMGFIKPNPAFFRAMTEELGAEPSRCLMVGDSLGSDVAGANAAGMDCIWFNRSGAPLPPAYRVKAVISHLNELLEIL